MQDHGADNSEGLSLYHSLAWGHHLARQSKPASVDLSLLVKLPLLSPS